MANESAELLLSPAETAAQAASLFKLSRIMRKAAETMSDQEAKLLVGWYYQLQEYRKAMTNQTRAAHTDSEPWQFHLWMAESLSTLENQVKAGLDRFSTNHVLGKAVREVVGIGPVLASGLLAHIDIERAPTGGHIWSIAGLNPMRKWWSRADANTMVRDVLDSSVLAFSGKGLSNVADAQMTKAGPKKELSMSHLAIVADRMNAKLESLLKMLTDKNTGKLKKLTPDNVSAVVARRPWNADLKKLCYLIGESFIKVQNNPRDYYGKVYAARKAEETAKNEKGEYAGQAEEKLRTCNIGKTTEAYGHYSGGRLSPAHIHARARRYAVKLFLSDYHCAAYRLIKKENPPKPFVLEHIPGHTHLRVAPWVPAEIYDFG